MSEPAEFTMDMDEPGEQAAVSDTATDAATDAAQSDGGGTVTDGLLSSEPDLSPSDAGDLFDTEQPWHAHAEVFVRKFLHGYGGIDGSPAILHLFVAVAALADEMSEESGDGDDDDGDDSAVFSDESSLDELPE